MTEAWWNAFKYGPVVLAAFVALWTAGLLTIELNREKGIRPLAIRLISIFMAFCLVLTAISYGLTLLQTNPQIDTSLGDLSGQLAGKEGVIENLPIPPTNRDQLKKYVIRMCKDVISIADLVNAKLPDDCKTFIDADAMQAGNQAPKK